MNSAVTVAIFTYERPKYLKRQLKLFEELGMPQRLLVLDGSHTNEILEANQAICKHYSIEIIRESSMQQRHVLLNERLDTEFVSYAADDDLIFPQFYTEASKFLRENSEYSVVAGKLPTFGYVKNYLWLGYYYRDYLNNSYDFYHGDFLERLLRRDQSYYLGCPPTFYGVRRSSVHKTFSKYVSSLKQFSSMERLEAIVNCLHGGMKVLDVIMGLRDYTSEPTRNVERDDPGQYICDEDIDRLRDIIREELKTSESSRELLEYYAQYAWLLPMRKIQCAGPGKESKPKLAIECILNKYFLAGPFDKKTSIAIRNSQKELSR